MNICSLVREQENNYTSGEVKLGKYVNWSMYDTLQTIDAYLNSTHTSGKTDALDREKPFFNIVTSTVNIWYRATDIDRKDIRIIPTKNKDLVPAFIATVKLQEWMNKERFGQFLNLWGRSLARYGSSVVKFVKQDGRLIPSVVSWNRLIVDPVDFYSMQVIEKIYLTPSQLRQKKEYDQEMVEKLLSSRDARQDRETLEGQSQDLTNEFIELYEVHGELPLSLLTHNEKDDNVYRQQMHVVSFIESNEGEYDDYTLFSGKEQENPYMITHLIEEDGRTLSIGAVEYLFDAQWMVNHSIKQQRDYLDLASKLIFQTADTHFVGRNVLSSIETGEILIHSPNMPVTQVNNTVGNISALQGFGAQWVNLSRELTSTPDAVRGNTMPSGTPYSLGAILQQGASSLFEIMTENKGLAIEDMMRLKIIPFIKTQLDTSDEIMATLDEQGIAQIDSIYVPKEAIRRYNKQAIKKIINDEVPTPFNPQEGETEIRKELAPLGNMRSFKPSEISSKTWKTVFKDLEWRVIVEVTNEAMDKQAVLTTLSTTLQSIASNPAILQDPNAKMLFAKILMTAGAISPLELSATPTPTPSPLQPSVMGQPTGEPAI